MQKLFNHNLLLLVFIVMFYSTAFSQKETALDKYKYRTLSEIITFNQSSTDEIIKNSKLEEQRDFIGIDLFYSRVRIQFIGKPRPISNNHRDLIKLWGKLQGIDEKIISLYENEILFKECDREYWIPIQENVGKSFLKEIKAKQMVTLFVIHIGGRKERMAKEFDWLFLSTGFEN